MSNALTYSVVHSSVFRRCFVGLVISVSTLLSSNACAQEEQAALSVEQLYQKWQSVNAELDAIEAKINASDGTDKKLKNEHRDLIDKAKRLVDTMENAAKAKLNSDRTSSLPFRILMGIALDAATKDDDWKVVKLGDFLISKGINRKYFEIASKSERLSIAQREIFDELQIRHDEAMKNDLPRVRIKTNKGEIVVELFENEAPGTVGNFVSLVNQGYYRDRLFHRVMEDFMAQTGGYRKGDTKAIGPGYTIKDEFKRPDKRLHFTGSLSMANTGAPDSGSAQFFLTFKRTDFLDDLHTVFGRVVEGHEVMENLERTHTSSPYGQDIPIEGATPDMMISAELIRSRDHEYVPDKATDPAKKAEQKPEESSKNDKADDGDGGLELNSPDGGG
ncbi:MAG: peptidylprolyl isomerase [Planctomycetota bacterium]